MNRPLTKKVRSNFLILLFSFLFSSALFAQVDYHSETLLRQYPLGAYLRGQVGYSHKLWEKENSKLPIMYGMVRPALELRTSGTINTATPMLEVYPIAPLGIFASYSYVNRENDDLPSFHCRGEGGPIICRSSRYIRKTFGFKLALKFKSTFLVTNQRWEAVGPEDKKNQGDFADEQTSLIGRSGGDNAYQGVYILGQEIREDLAAGILFKRNSMDKSNTNSNMKILFGMKKWGKWSLLAGPGAYHTRGDREVFTFLAVLKWDGEKGALLF